MLVTIFVHPPLPCMADMVHAHVIPPLEELDLLLLPLDVVTTTLELDWQWSGDLVFLGPGLFKSALVDSFPALSVGSRMFGKCVRLEIYVDGWGCQPRQESTSLARS
jgi:hypothetical protein